MSRPLSLVTPSLAGHAPGRGSCPQSLDNPTPNRWSHPRSLLTRAVAGGAPHHWPGGSHETIEYPPVGAWPKALEFIKQEIDTLSWPNSSRIRETLKSSIPELNCFRCVQSQEISKPDPGFMNLAKKSGDSDPKLSHCRLLPQLYSTGSLCDKARNLVGPVRQQLGLRR